MWATKPCAKTENLIFLLVQRKMSTFSTYCACSHNVVAESISIYRSIFSPLKSIRPSTTYTVFRISIMCRPEAMLCMNIGCRWLIYFFELLLFIIIIDTSKPNPSHPATNVIRYNESSLYCNTTSLILDIHNSHSIETYSILSKHVCVSISLFIWLRHFVFHDTTLQFVITCGHYVRTFFVSFFSYSVDGMRSIYFLANEMPI